MQRTTRKSGKVYLRFRWRKKLWWFPAGQKGRVADTVERRLSDLIDCVKNGVRLTETLESWIAGLSREQRGRLEEAGLLAAGSRAALVQSPLADVIDAWEQYLTGARFSPNYPRVASNYVRRVLVDQLGATIFSELRSGIIVGAVQKYSRANGWATSTMMSVLAHLRCVGIWVSAEAGVSNPMAGVPIREVSRDEQVRVRRALTEDEQGLLLQVTAEQPTRAGSTALERLALWAVALNTGLRAGALARVRDVDVKLDDAVLDACGSGATNKKASPKPLNRTAIGALRSILDGPPTGKLLFPILRGGASGSKRVCRALAADLAAAGIPVRDDMGRQVDFHALRHTFGTTMARKGTPVHLLMRLMDHANPRTTMRYYTHVFSGDERDAVAALDRPAENTGVAAKVG